MSEAMAQLRQRMKKLDFSSGQIDQIPDSFIEAVIRTTRRLQSMSPVEQEIEVYGRPLDETTNEETTSEKNKDRVG
jgi:hypothetical protein